MLLAFAIKAAMLLGASWIGAALLGRSSAAARHQIWTLGVVGALLLPLLAWLLPPLALTPELGEAINAPAVYVTAGHSTATSAASAWPTWFAIAWAAGTLLVALRFARGHLAARRLVKTAEPSFATEALREAVDSLGITGRITLLRSEHIGSPMTIGVLRPRVLLPAAADAWSPESLRAVLVHELGHVRRRDSLVQLAAQLACALYWWNPLAWVAAARLRTEREHACDDLVLRTGVLPSSYAGELLNVARSMSTTAHAGAICMVDQSSTEARIRRVLDATTPRRSLRTPFRIAAVGIALASTALLACTSSPPPTRGTLSVGAPFIRQGVLFAAPAMFQSPIRPKLDLPLVTAEVNRRLGELERCYERRLKAKPKLAGTVAIHFVITETGDVPEQCITTDTVNDLELVECVNALVSSGKFPAASGGAVDVSYPFVFASR